jgi:phospholipid-transporting ATPase
VLCCRVSPKQKQEIVALVKNALPYAITLAIGDGANDVNMITEAHVGVGIKGVEGQQAARAADFSIGEFKALKRLMFFHGRENYRKNTNLILYNFYKNLLFNMPTLWFGYFNWFSGQSPFENTGMTLFNMIYTSAPIILYSLFDRETTDIVLLKNPRYYDIGRLDYLLNIWRFARWYLWAAVLAIIISFMAYPIYQAARTCSTIKQRRKTATLSDSSPQAKSSSFSWSLPRT